MVKKDDEISFHVLVKAKNGKKMSSLGSEKTLAEAEATFKERVNEGKTVGRLLLTRCHLGSHTILKRG